METISPKSLPRTIPEAIPVRYCLYARKLTDQDEKQALSIESQVKEMLQIAEQDELEVIGVHHRLKMQRDEMKMVIRLIQGCSHEV